MSASEPAYPDPGPKSELAWLPVARLAIDGTYQRDISSKRSQNVIRTIALNFSWSRFGVVVCVIDGDRWLLLDGQHRVQAVRQRGDISHVPAVVLKGMTRGEAALHFVGINRDRASMSTLQIHKALLTAGDADACAIDEAVSASGIEILAYPVKASNIKPLQTLALGALQWVYRTYGGKYLARICTMLAAAYPDEAAAIRAPVIRAAAIAAYPNADAGIARALGKQPAASLVRLAEQRRRPGQPLYAALIDELTGADRTAGLQVKNIPAAAPHDPVRAPNGGPPVPPARLSSVTAEDVQAARRGLAAMGFDVEPVGGGLFRLGDEKHDAAGLVEFHARMRDGGKSQKQGQKGG